jgi:hypothetical protein
MQKLGRYFPHFEKILKLHSFTPFTSSELANIVVVLLYDSNHHAIVVFHVRGRQALHSKIMLKKLVSNFCDEKHT